MRVSVLTPTCDRPVGFALAERWMRAQTRQPDEWIVADGGRVPVVPTMGQRHLHHPGIPGAANFRANLLHGLGAVTGDVVVLVEDDDHYAPTHIGRLVEQFSRKQNVVLAGDDQQRYYNLPVHCWRVMQNRGASLCQTAIRRDGLATFARAIHRAATIGSGYGVDGALWDVIPPAMQSLERTQTVCGIKGLPGRKGLGMGHRPNGPGWTDDRDGSRLRMWLGADAEVYLNGRGVVGCP